MIRRFAFLGAVSGLLGVAAGAFGAHALRAELAPRQLNAFEVAVRYQMYHSLALWVVACALSAGVISDRHARWAGYAFVAGLVLFSGSLYAYALTGARGAAMITPLGGLCFIVAWGALAWAALRGSRLGS